MTRDNPGWRELPVTWKISVSAVAIHVYRSPRDLWVSAFGVPYGQNYGTKKQAMAKARQLSGRYHLRILSE